MSFYTKCYYNICERGKQAKNLYGKYSGLHEHHIVPKHSGGTDEDSNLTYLTPREHTIAHYLLWKIHQNVNDLRSMKMLGVKLSVEKRRLIGIWCKENKIGIHGYTKDVQKANALSGFQSQKDSDSKDTFYFWSTEEGRKKRASMGGKASIVSGNNIEFAYWMSPEGRKKRASMGGKANFGKRTMYKPGDKSFIRVKPENIQEYLNMGYILGSPISPQVKGTKTNIPSTRRRKVSDGTNIYESVHDAAIKNKVTNGAIVYRCKSKKSSWHYVSDTEF
jgi:hypothetical protein